MAMSKNNFFEREVMHIFSNNILMYSVGLLTLMNIIKPERFLQAWPLKSS